MVDTKVDDAARFEAEVSGEPAFFEWKGRTYELPGALPAIVMVRAVRLQKTMGESAVMPADKAIEMLEQIVGGEEALDAILIETKTTAPEVPDMLQAALRVYQGNREARRAPARGGRSTSSNTGRGSRRTSSGSTGSTSRKR